MGLLRYTYYKYSCSLFVILFFYIVYIVSLYSPIPYHMLILSLSPPPPQYEIVPVGTNGFRSPESSMLMIANSPDAFSPPLSTKADIYSFGILSMRLMMSTDTPYSQRAMSTLLLYYHQSLGVSEGRLKSPSVWRVEESTVLKLLKVSIAMCM